MCKEMLAYPVNTNWKIDIFDQKYIDISENWWCDEIEKNKDF